jgi:hypothetical protein
MAIPASLDSSLPLIFNRRAGVMLNVVIASATAEAGNGRSGRARPCSRRLGVIGLARLRTPRWDFFLLLAFLLVAH